MWKIAGLGKKSVTYKDIGGSEAVLSLQEKEEGYVELTYLGVTLKGKTKMMMLESRMDVLNIQKLRSNIVKTQDGKFLKLSFIFKETSFVVDLPLTKL